METPAALRRVDARSVAITGLTTLAWYAVPDVVGPRWARALAKAGVLAGGFGLGMVVTTEGRSVVEGIRESRDEARELRDLADRIKALPPEGADEEADEEADEDGPGVAEPEGDAAGRTPDAHVPEDNVLLGDPELVDGADPLPDPVVAGSVTAGAIAFGIAVAVLGEKWAYRRGERWRAQGRRLPHTRVGLVLGVLAAAATALEPSAAARLADGQSDQPADQTADQTADRSGDGPAAGAR
ncbi:hypothetical protein ACH436_17610 [Isoptericola sp. NPDC019693]|uniref:hypothetical protein n=1 Tax=Isoptericola sp. NPDC019693 TaxID=3364009 RepID=UPI0037AD0CDC